jgi:signal transduction histidine kinase
MAPYLPSWFQAGCLSLTADLATGGRRFSSRSIRRYRLRDRRPDSMLLPVILRYLIGNAIKYTRHGSVQLRVRTEATELYIDVIDSGPGIPQEHLQRLFEAFYQVDNSNRDQREGVGLGLSIVQTICRLLEHTVTIESRDRVDSTCGKAASQRARTLYTILTFLRELIVD